MGGWIRIIGRLLSLIIGIVYSVLVVHEIVPSTKTTAEAALRSCETCAVIFIPVALIWFPVQIGAATGFIGHSFVNAETPPILVAIMGWIFLLGLPLAAYWFR